MNETLQGVLLFFFKTHLKGLCTGLDLTTRPCANPGYRLKKTNSFNERSMEMVCVGFSLELERKAELFPDPVTLTQCQVESSCWSS